MDIVDPLIDDYLTRLAGSPDPVEAEMRRYADERDGFPIVGQTLGTLLGQLAILISLVVTIVGLMLGLAGRDDPIGLHGALICATGLLIIALVVLRLA